MLAHESWRKWWVIWMGCYETYWSIGRGLVVQVPCCQHHSSGPKGASGITWKTIYILKLQTAWDWVKRYHSCSHSFATELTLFKYPTDISFKQGKPPGACKRRCRSREGRHKSPAPKYEIVTSSPWPKATWWEDELGEHRTQTSPNRNHHPLFMYESKVQEHSHETCDVFISSSSCQNEPEMSLSPKQYA